MTIICIFLIVCFDSFANAKLKHEMLTMLQCFLAHTLAFHLFYFKILSSRKIAHRINVESTSGKLVAKLT